MVAPTYTIENTKLAYENWNNDYFFFVKRPFFPEQISFYFITPPEGPLWKQGHIESLGGLGRAPCKGLGRAKVLGGPLVNQLC